MSSGEPVGRPDGAEPVGRADDGGADLARTTRRLAHEMKNELAVLFGHVELAIERSERDGSAPRESLETIRRAAIELSSLTTQLAHAAEDSPTSLSDRSV